MAMRLLGLVIAAPGGWRWLGLAHVFLADYGRGSEKIIRAHSALGWEGRGYGAKGRGQKGLWENIQHPTRNAQHPMTEEVARGQKGSWCVCVSKRRRAGSAGSTAGRMPAATTGGCAATMDWVWLMCF